MSVKENFADAFAYAESQIDYEKIRAFMVLTGWTYAGSKKVPSVTELRNTLLQLYYTAYKEFDLTKSTRCTMGGFYLIIWVWSETSIEVDLGFAADRYSTTFSRD